jgi:hypothetical protein
MSYPKYLMEQKLGRPLGDNETIDHLDGNFLNNSDSNLKIKDRISHNKDDVIRRKGELLKCVWCNKEFECDAVGLHNRSRKRAGPFCSKSCSGKYGRSVQMNQMDRLPEQKYEPIYYTNKDLNKQV